MPDLLVATFLVAHGLVHLAIYAVPADPSKPAPFDPSRSWVLVGRGVDAVTMRSASAALARVTAAAYAIAGAMLLLGAPWEAAGAVAAGAGLSLKSLWFHPWLVLGVGIDLAVLAVVMTGGL